MSMDIMECTKEQTDEGGKERAQQPSRAPAFSTLEFSQQELDQAAGTGHAEVLDWLWEESNGAVHPSSMGLQMAAAAGNIVTLEWAHSRGLRGFEGLADVAAWRGRLSVLEWLLANGIEGGTINAVNWAAGSGHLNVLRWLRDNLGLHECTSEGLEAAAVAGHVRVVAWLLRNDSERANGQGPAVTPAVVGAASNGHAHVLELLLRARQQDQDKSGWAMALAVRGGHRECIRLLQAAGWPEQRAMADDENGEGLGVQPPVEGAPGNCGEVLLLPQPRRGRDGDSGDFDDGRRNSSLLGECAETPTPTPTPIGPPAGGGSGDGGREQRTSATAPRCAQQQPLPTAAETAPLRRHSSGAAGTPSPPSARLRSSRRVLSMGMTLPGPQPEGETTPSRLRALLEEAPVSRTPRGLCFSGPAASWEEQLLTERSTTPSRSTLRSLHTTPARGDGEARKEEGAGAVVEIQHGICVGERRWFSEGAGGIYDGGSRRCPPDVAGGSRREGLLGAEGALLAAAGGDNIKSRVRDVWSPVSGVADALEARLNLGALAEESQEPVISAYLAGLLRDPGEGSSAACRSRHLCSSRDRGSGARSRRPPPTQSCRLFRHLHPAAPPPTPLWSWKPLPPRARSPPGLVAGAANIASAAAPAAAAAACSAGASAAAAAATAAAPRRLSATRREDGEGRALSSPEQQRGRGRRLRFGALCRPRGGSHGGRITAAGHPAPPASAPCGTRTAGATAETRRHGRARSAPGHSTAPRSRPCDCIGEKTGHSPNEEWGWYENERALLAVGPGGAPDAARYREHGRQEQRKQQELSSCGMSCRGEDPDSSLLCRGWGRWRRRAAPQPTEGGSADGRAAQPPRSPEEGSPGFGGGHADRFGPARRSQQELVPRNMFLTRAHRGIHRFVGSAGAD